MMDDGRAHAGFADVTITYKQPKKHHQTHKHTYPQNQKSAHTPARTFSNTYTPLVLYALTHLIKAKTKDPERRSGPVRGVDSIDSSRFGGSRTVKRTPPLHREKGTSRAPSALHFETHDAERD